MTTESIILVRSTHADRAYPAFAELREADADLTGLQVRSAALVQRRTDGTLHMLEYDDAWTGPGTASGGLVGMLVGVLGGPLGSLLGFGTGTGTSGVFDPSRTTQADGALASLSREIPPSSTVLIIEVAEATPQPAHQLAARFNATVQRQPAFAVISEVQAAAEAAQAAGAARAAQRQANLVRERKRAEFRARIDQRLGVLKERLQVG